MNKPTLAAVWPDVPRPQHSTSPSSVIPHVWEPPADTAWNSPDGSGNDWPDLLSPEQVRVPLFRVEHAWAPPAEMARRTNRPEDGGVAWPLEFCPQHDGVPSDSTPQAWFRPAPIDRKVPAGASASPDPSLPRHTAFPLLRTAHVNWYPAATEL
jgi:hypothetical protein